MDLSRDVAEMPIIDVGSQMLTTALSLPGCCLLVFQMVRSWLFSLLSTAGHSNIIEDL